MTKIDIFSGFLGAGKTTLIKKLIKEAYSGERLVLIENEFGEIGVDGGFMAEAGIKVNELNSGCICCSLVGDFSAALKKVYAEYKPDRILIEPSGVGKLSDVIRAVENADLKDCKINAYAAVVDAAKCKMYMKNFGEFFNDQIEAASCIIFSHTDVAGAEKTEAALKLVKQRNANATTVTTAWSELDGKEILSAMEHSVTLAGELQKLAEHEHGHCCHGHDHEHEYEDGHCCHGHDHEHKHGHGHHHADDVFASWGVETGKKFSKAELEKMLASLSDSVRFGTVLRAKGIVAGENGWLHFDYIPNEINVREGAAAYTGRLCVIGSKIDGEELKDLFGV